MRTNFDFLLNDPQLEPFAEAACLGRARSAYFPRPVRHRVPDGAGICGQVGLQRGQNA